VKFLCLVSHLHAFQAAPIHTPPTAVERAFAATPQGARRRRGGGALRRRSILAAGGAAGGASSEARAPHERDGRRAHSRDSFSSRRKAAANNLAADIMQSRLISYLPVARRPKRGRLGRIWIRTCRRREHSTKNARLSYVSTRVSEFQSRAIDTPALFLRCATLRCAVLCCTVHCCLSQPALRVVAT
jgi:hypothetical protein